MEPSAKRARVEDKGHAARGGAETPATIVTAPHQEEASDSHAPGPAASSADPNPGANEPSDDSWLEYCARSRTDLSRFRAVPRDPHSLAIVSVTLPQCMSPDERADDILRRFTYNEIMDLANDRGVPPGFGAKEEIDISDELLDRLEMVEQAIVKSGDDRLREARWVLDEVVETTGEADRSMRSPGANNYNAPDADVQSLVANTVQSLVVGEQGQERVDLCPRHYTAGKRAGPHQRDSLVGFNAGCGCCCGTCDLCMEDEEFRSKYA